MVDSSVVHALEVLVELELGLEVEPELEPELGLGLGLGLEPEPEPGLGLAVLAVLVALIASVVPAHADSSAASSLLSCCSAWLKVDSALVTFSSSSDKVCCAVAEGVFRGRDGLSLRGLVVGGRLLRGRQG